MLVNATAALEMGLLHEVVAPSALDDAIEATLALLLLGGPVAQGQAKQLVSDVLTKPEAQLPEYTARLLSMLRASPEGKQGLTAFLENEKPDWVR
jgi:methylglutaconyl-CoA hydratase